jgi:outer membrane protein assembly factor BamB
VLVLIGEFDASTFADDWPQFLGPHANGVSDETGLLQKWPTNGLPLVWEKKIGAGYGAPSVRGELLVFHHRVADEEIIEGLEAATGKGLWRYAYPSHFVDPYGYNNGPRSSPLLTAERCYTFGAEGKLLCLELKTGKLIWQRDTAADWTVPPAFFGVGSSPILVSAEATSNETTNSQSSNGRDDFHVVPSSFSSFDGERPRVRGDNGLLIVMVGGQPNAGVVALDPATGKTVWESVGEKNWQGQPMTGWPGERKVNWQTWEKQASYSTPVAATIHGQRHLLCLMRQGLVSLNPANGAVNFSFWFRSPMNESVNAMVPVVVDDLILISGAYYKIGSVLLRIAAMSETSRSIVEAGRTAPASNSPVRVARPGRVVVEEVWRSTVLELHWNTPIHHNGFVYAFSGRNEPDAHFRCVEFKTGKLMWDRDEKWQPHSTPTPDVYGRGSCLMADGKLIVLGEGGLLGLFELNPQQPKEISRFQVPQLHYPCWAAPILSKKRLYLRSEDRLLCLDVAKTAI